MGSKRGAGLLTWINALESEQTGCGQIMGRLLLLREGKSNAMHAALVCIA